jgi:predicted SAM-dependent methyltransferase
MRMMFGGHIDAYDYHKAGLNEDFLASYLLHAGFTNLRRVNGFEKFEDSSSAVFKGVPISLNIIAEKA